MEEIAAEAPGVQPIEASWVSGPESNGFVYVAMRFSREGVVLEGVWGATGYGSYIGVDKVAREVSDWPTELDQDPDAGRDEKSIDAALRCLGDG